MTCCSTKDKHRYRGGSIEFTIKHLIQDDFGSDNEILLDCLVHYVKTADKINITKRYVKKPFSNYWSVVYLKDKQLVNLINETFKLRLLKVSSNASTNR